MQVAVQNPAVSVPMCFKQRSEAPHHAVATSAGYMHKEDTRHQMI